MGGGARQETAARVRELEAELAREKAAVYDMVEACKRAEGERDAVQHPPGHRRAAGLRMPDDQDCFHGAKCCMQARRTRHCIIWYSPSR